MECLAHEGTCPGMRYAIAHIALGDSPIWARRQDGTLHAHPVYLLEYVKHGSMAFQPEGGPVRELGPGEYYIAPPDFRHGHAVRSDIATIHVGMRAEFVRRVVAEGMPGSGLPFFPDPARRASPALEALLRKLVQEARQPSPWRRLLVETLATQLVVQLVRDHGYAVPEGHGYGVADGHGPTGAAGNQGHAVVEEPVEAVDGITRVIEVILSHYHKDLTLAALAAEASMSRYHFLRQFKKRVGQTPLVYLRQIRLEQAAHLLSSTNLPVTEVALRCGFGGPNRLAEATRQAWGVSPGAYRARAQG